tara:strand:+ start:33 stop:683 length:651 start_codon:yes stop_codon:yes gene_type:complete
MNKYPFEKPNQVLVPIKSSDEYFPVNQIYCVGRNYVAHAKEMGADENKPPFFFTKPNWAITTGDVKYPKKTKDLQYEVELVLAIGKDLSIFGFAIGVDLTRRDLQGDAKKNGKPWFSGKCFTNSAPISEIVPKAEGVNFSDFEIRLALNNQLKQLGYCSDMILSPLELISELSEEIPLLQGDLVFTGTPQGVGSLNVGDKVDAFINDIVSLSFKIK